MDLVGKQQSIDVMNSRNLNEIKFKEGVQLPL